MINKNPDPPGSNLTADMLQIAYARYQQNSKQTQEPQKKNEKSKSQFPSLSDIRINYFSGEGKFRYSGDKYTSQGFELEVPMPAISINSQTLNFNSKLGWGILIGGARQHSHQNYTEVALDGTSHHGNDDLIPEGVVENYKLMGIYNVKTEVSEPIGAYLNVGGFGIGPLSFSGKIGAKLSLLKRTQELETVIFTGAKLLDDVCLTEDGLPLDNCDQYSLYNFRTTTRPEPKVVESGKSASYFLQTNVGFGRLPISTGMRVTFTDNDKHFTVDGGIRYDFMLSAQLPQWGSSLLGNKNDTMKPQSETNTDPAQNNTSESFFSPRRTALIRDNDQNYNRTQNFGVEINYGIGPTVDNGMKDEAGETLIATNITQAGKTTGAYLTNADQLINSASRYLTGKEIPIPGWLDADIGYVRRSVGESEYNVDKDKIESHDYYGELNASINQPGEKVEDYGRLRINGLKMGAMEFFGGVTVGRHQSDYNHYHTRRIHEKSLDEANKWVETYSEDMSALIVYDPLRYQEPEWYLGKNIGLAINRGHTQFNFQTHWDHENRTWFDFGLKHTFGN